MESKLTSHFQELARILLLKQSLYLDSLPSWFILSGPKQWKHTKWMKHPSISTIKKIFYLLKMQSKFKTQLHHILQGNCKADKLAAEAPLKPIHFIPINNPLLPKFVMLDFHQKAPLFT